MDAEACYRAIEGRDARFAGRFFLGVRTTNIYCRPGCPARVPRRENVIFFPSAAAAQAAGFRACLRCRPDAAPGSPAQAGTAATLSRALRLLEESGDAAGLADRLGVTDRHLRRLFARHLGASPAEVLRTRRLHLARQLLETSSLRIIDVAHAAGFQSLRRFNEAVRRGFGRTPSQLRTLPEGWLAVQRAGPGHLEARMPAALAPRALQIAARIQRVFDLRADPRPIVEHLSADAALKSFLRSGLRVPGAWDPFEMAVRAILGQQISVQRARAMGAALIARFAGFPTAAQLADAELDGMPAVRATAIAQLARSVVDGRVRLDGSQDLETVTAALCEIAGIGDWTAQVIALRALGEPDAFPAADLGLCQALELAPRALRQRAEGWRPWRAYAAAAIWLS